MQVILALSEGAYKDSPTDILIIYSSKRRSRLLKQIKPFPHHTPIDSLIRSLVITLITILFSSWSLKQMPHSVGLYRGTLRWLSWPLCSFMLLVSLTVPRIIGPKLCKWNGLAMRLFRRDVFGWSHVVRNSGDLGHRDICRFINLLSLSRPYYALSAVTGKLLILCVNIIVHLFRLLRKNMDYWLDFSWTH